METVLAVLIGTVMRIGIPIAVLTLITLTYTRYQKRHAH